MFNVKHKNVKLCKSYIFVNEVLSNIFNYFLSLLI